MYLEHALNFFFVTWSPKTAMIRTEPEQSLKCQIDLIWKSEDFCL